MRRRSTYFTWYFHFGGMIRGNSGRTQRCAPTDERQSAAEAGTTARGGRASAHGAGQSRSAPRLAGEPVVRAWSRSGADARTNSGYAAATGGNTRTAGCSKLGLDRRATRRSSCSIEDCTNGYSAANRACRSTDLPMRIRRKVPPVAVGVSFRGAPCGPPWGLGAPLMAQMPVRRRRTGFAGLVNRSAAICSAIDRKRHRGRVVSACDRANEDRANVPALSFPIGSA